MGKGLVIGLVVVVVLALVLVYGFAQFGGQDVVTDNTNGLDDAGGDVLVDGDGIPDTGGPDVGDFGEPQTHTITMEAERFSPSDLVINLGDTVEFFAADSSRRWPASDVHPSHTVYPGSGISKCGSAEEAMIFDSCGPVFEGDSYSFTFDAAGEWSYHDHNQPSKKGTITVVEI